MFTWKRRPPPKFETCGSEVEHWVGGVLAPWVEPGHKSCSHPRERATLFLLNLVTPPCSALLSSGALSQFYYSLVAPPWNLSQMTTLLVLESQGLIINEVPTFSLSIIYQYGESYSELISPHLS